ncbi:DNA-directed RNA polymerase subunit D [Acidilobus sp.]|uniref:DNA-directed RNA polymerase subunit D n=1 Tax=Acidilobus sp. TaxID=1872109 RepID=UPI003D015084
MQDQKVSIVELSNNRITVSMEGFPVAYGNALRRLALSEVPTMAVDFVYFYDNESSVYDEIIAHRLGLLVLRSDEALRRYGSPEECSNASENDSHCFAQVYLEYEVPQDAASGVYVKASDLKFSDPDIRPVYPETPIVYLAPGQRIHLVGYARLGRGYEHGKWSPASVSVLRYSVHVEYDPSKVASECLECISAYQDLVGAIKGGSAGMLELNYKVNTSALRYCEEESCKGAIKVIYDPSKLYLTVESTGALEPARIIWEATNCLARKADKLLKELEEAQVVEEVGPK